jgi:hypothetical protein
MVLGGPQAAVLGARLGPEFTTVVLGEIEAVDPAFYRDLLCGTLSSTYAALSTGGRRPPFGNPYRPEDFSGPLANRSIYYESSRGCPFHCSYCLSAAEHGVRHKDLAEVEGELSLILACRPKVVRFVDRTFNDQPQRALAIWHMLAACGGETLFHFEIAPERFSEEMFAFLAGVPPGRFQFEIGVQSTNPATLAAVNRRIDPEVAATTVSRLAGPGNIHLHVDLILGLPYETRESFAGSFRDIFALGAHYVQMGLLKILPDTPISRQAADWGYRYSSDPPYAVFCSQWLDHPGLAELYHLAEVVERFVNTRYLSPCGAICGGSTRMPSPFSASCSPSAAGRTFFSERRPRNCSVPSLSLPPGSGRTERCLSNCFAMTGCAAAFVFSLTPCNSQPKWNHRRPPDPPSTSDCRLTSPAFISPANGTIFSVNPFSSGSPGNCSGKLAWTKGQRSR